MKIPGLSYGHLHHCRHKENLFCIVRCIFLTILNRDILLSLSSKFTATVFFIGVVFILGKVSSSFAASDVAVDHREGSRRDQRMQMILQLFLRAGE
jgi:hypothetical protein